MTEPASPYTAPSGADTDDGAPARQSGLQRIREERTKQVVQKGYTAEHDAQHNGGQLMVLASMLLTFIDAPARYPSRETDAWFVHEMHRLVEEKSEMELLAVAGALLAAEMDRRTEAETGAPVANWHAPRALDDAEYLRICEDLVHRASKALNDTERAPDNWWRDYLKYVDGGHYVHTEEGHWVAGACLRELADEFGDDLPDFIRDEINRPADTDLPVVMP